MKLPTLPTPSSNGITCLPKVIIDNPAAGSSINHTASCCRCSTAALLRELHAAQPAADSNKQKHSYNTGKCLHGPQRSLEPTTLEPQASNGGVWFCGKERDDTQSSEDQPAISARSRAAFHSVCLLICLNRPQPTCDQYSAQITDIACHDNAAGGLLMSCSTA